VFIGVIKERMGSHPLNLGLRFVLELLVLASSSYWVWVSLTGWKRNIFVILLPIIIGAVWGCFAVPNDPSRAGSAVIPIPGLFRLALELTIFGAGVWFLYQSNLVTSSWIFAAIVTAHYLASHDRIAWLFKQR